MKRITLTDLSDNQGDTLEFSLNGRSLRVEANSGPGAPTNHSKLVFLTPEQTAFLIGALPKLDGKAIPTGLPKGCEVE